MSAIDYSAIIAIFSLSPRPSMTTPLSVAPPSEQELRDIDAYWRACNYLAAGMIYLRDNPLLKEPLKVEHVKSRLLGHWGASPGLSFTYQIGRAHVQLQSQSTH